MRLAGSLTTAAASITVTFMPCMIPATVLAATSAPAASEDRESADVQAAYERWERFVAAAVHSSNPRLRVVLSFGGYPGGFRDGVRYDPLPLSEVVELERGSTDPLVLAMLANRCSMSGRPQAPCDAVDFARRWTVAETQNKLAWLTLAALAAARGDAAEAEAAYARSASASLWHEHLSEVEALVDDALPADLDDLERSAAFERSQSLAAVQATPFAALSYLARRCRLARLDDELALCAQTMDTVVRDTRSLMSYRIAVLFAERVARPQAAALQRHYDAVWWAIVDADRGEPIGEVVDARSYLHGLRAMREARGRLGELGYGEALLKRSGMSEAEAASRWRSQLAALQASVRSDRE